MNEWTAIILAVIAATTAYSVWKQFNFSIVVSAAIVACFAVTLLTEGTFGEVAFMPRDLVEPSRSYTVVTSMYAHGSFFHLFFNILGIVFIGSLLEQRIGPRPYVLLYFLTGLAGTLAFAAVHWSTPFVAVVGASGAISGVLGGLVRMYPHERMSMVVGFIPLPPMPLWAIVGIFLLLQMVFLAGVPNIAVEAHLGGLAAGLLLAPLVVKMPLHRKVKRMVSLSALRRMANTPELRAVLRRIEEEELPDVRSAWVEHFLSKARCPACGARIRIRRDAIKCERGHLL